MNYRRCEWQEAQPCSDEVSECYQDATTFIDDRGYFCAEHAEIVADQVAHEVVGQGPGVSVSAEQRAENLPPHEASQSRPYGSAISDVEQAVNSVLGATCRECFGEFFADEPNDANAVGDFCSLACEHEHKQQALMSEQP